MIRPVAFAFGLTLAAGAAHAEEKWYVPPDLTESYSRCIRLFTAQENAKRAEFVCQRILKATLEITHTEGHKI